MVPGTNIVSKDFGGLKLDAWAIMPLSSNKHPGAKWSPSCPKWYPSVVNCISVLCTHKFVRDSATMGIYIKYSFHSWIPSTWGGGKLGILFPRIAAFPRWSKIPKRPHRWWTASPSSCPVCLARADPSFLISPSVPTTKRFCCQGKESYSLPPAKLLCTI